MVSVGQELSPGGVSIVRGFNLVSAGQELSPGGGATRLDVVVL